MFEFHFSDFWEGSTFGNVLTKNEWQSSIRNFLSCYFHAILIGIDKILSTNKEILFSFKRKPSNLLWYFGLIFMEKQEIPFWQKTGEIKLKKERKTFKQYLSVVVLKLSFINLYFLNKVWYFYKKKSYKSKYQEVIFSSKM